MTHKPHDNIFAQKAVTSGDFVFDESVTAVFSDMIQRSVPGYSTMLAGIAAVAESTVQPNTNIYDLGCSQGAATAAAGQQIPFENCTLIAIDNSPAMIQHCEEKLAQVALKPQLEIVCGDIRKQEFNNASLVILNLTLQFIEEKDRLPLLQKIASGLLPGGVVILTEKTLTDDPKEQTLMTDLYHAFKRVNGYSQLEISNKRTALENVLIPEAESTHRERFQQAGFNQVSCWFHCFGFKAFIAVK